jgi:Family of unknown function (DUF6625)
MRNVFPSVLILAVFFGPLPPWFPLWLESCRRNPDFDWLVVADADCSGYDRPPNVRFRRMTLAEFGARMSDALGIEAPALTPYKVCDFRPAFWALLDGDDAICEFWGHCDLDVIFGDLRRFITPEILARHDKIFTLGHLTLYRNGDFANRMFQKPHPGLDWRAVLTDPRPRGFDEHIGVGLLWRAHRARLFKDESLVADIDPALARFERVAPFRNDRDQLFFCNRGRVFRIFWRRGRKYAEEFLYIHFQKRKAFSALVPAGTESYVLAPGGFFACAEDDLTPALARRLNPRRRNWKEALHCWRGVLRASRRRAGLIRDFRTAAR